MSDTRNDSQSINGLVEHFFSEVGRECQCCPNGRHRYSATIHIPIGSVNRAEHLNDVRGFVSDYISRHGMHGKRVRVTIETEPERAK